MKFRRKWFPRARTAGLAFKTSDFGTLGLDLPRPGATIPGGPITRGVVDAAQSGLRVSAARQNGGLCPAKQIPCLRNYAAGFARNIRSLG